MDCYGGWDSQRPLTETHEMDGPGGEIRVRLGPGRVQPHRQHDHLYIHFGFADDKKWKKAFTYHWRLYSPAEICDCLRLAGFTEARVFWDRSEDEDEDDFHLGIKADNTPGWLAYMVGEK